MKLFLTKKNLRIFTHNIQAHIFLNIFKNLKYDQSNKYCNVIHFDAFYVKKIWIFFYILSIKLFKPKLIFVSEYAYTQFQNFLDTKDFDTQVINNAIENKYFSPKTIKKNHTESKSKISVGFIGRYTPIKRLPLFLEICMYLNQINNRKYKFIIQSNINEKIIQKNFLKFHDLYPTFEYEPKFILYPEDNDPKEFYEECDIVISCSKTESFGLTCLETLAMKKRLYTINSKVMETLFKKNKFNIKCEDPKFISNFIEKDLLKSYKFPDLRKYTEKNLLEEYARI